MSDETIAAITTPPGRGGVGIVRLSGNNALSIAKKITRQAKITLRYAHFVSLYRQNDEIFDQGLLLFFKAPHSFTGEDVIEFQVHGSPIILDLLLQECLILGARQARPGEFSERAFLNDKIDLTQAEAIADLIQASSHTAARMAIKSLQGEFSKKIHYINELVIQLRLFVEAAIDFPEEEIDFISDGNISSRLQVIINELISIRKSAVQGAIIREGLSVVIVGRPNAGKSTLINCLAERDVAIVTSVPGTTRDVMREHVLLNDMPLHLIDTAGLRDSDNLVEQEGIKRAWLELSRADCILMVIDIADLESEIKQLNEEVCAKLSSDIPIIFVYNKIDLRYLAAKSEKNVVYLSAKSGDGLYLLKEKLKEVIGYQVTEGQFLARRRHIQALDSAKQFLLTGQQQLMDHRAGELLAEDLRLAHQSLSEITGEFTSDDLLGTIFSSFCIGK